MVTAADEPPGVGAAASLQEVCPKPFLVLLVSTAVGFAKPFYAAIKLSGVPLC